MANTIEVADLHKHYGDVRAVDGVSFDVAEGEFFGILGPNGAGKTTALEVVEGLREPDSGTVTVLGERPWPRNPRLLPRIGVQLQASSFFERLTAREQIAQRHLPGLGNGNLLDSAGDFDHGNGRHFSASSAHRKKRPRLAPRPFSSCDEVPDQNL